MHILHHCNHQPALSARIEKTYLGNVDNKMKTSLSKSPGRGNARWVQAQFRNKTVIDAMNALVPPEELDGRRKENGENSMRGHPFGLIYVRLSFAGQNSELEHPDTLFARSPRPDSRSAGDRKTALLNEFRTRAPLLICKDTSKITSICSGLEQELGRSHHGLSVTTSFFCFAL
jgi:hypothetical protein